MFSSSNLGRKRKPTADGFVFIKKPERGYYLTPASGQTPPEPKFYRCLCRNCQAFHTCPGAVEIVAMALRVSTMHLAHAASS